MIVHGVKRLGHPTLIERFHFRRWQFQFFLIDHIYSIAFRFERWAMWRQMMTDFHFRQYYHLPLTHAKGKGQSIRDAEVMKQ